ncbi:MAG TPA: hypothetical protein DCR40_05915 [Prolixibacteraceae bacterium]|nr:hypothetical protein [Prolixibacteraceae bacterium]
MNKGTSQKSRKNLALIEDAIAIDERSLLDLVRFTLDFSRNIDFYSLQNKVIENKEKNNSAWKSFFLNDSAFIIAMIATTDINISKYKINNDDIDNHFDRKKETEKVKVATREIRNLITYWSELLKRSNYNGTILREINKLLVFVDENNTLLGNNPDLETLKETYDTIYGNLVFFKEKAANKFEKEILSNSNHYPHTGLLLAFFKLFENVQHDINTLTKKHLDFYFLNLLQQQRKKLNPGTAIIGLQLQQGAEDLIINEGDQCDFIFEGNQQCSFVADSTTTINKAEIAEIRTLYKSDDYPFGREFEADDFSINRFYEADILKIGKYQMNPEIIQDSDFPAILGEENFNDYDYESNIRLSEVGLIISSPVLILENGRQEISLIFKITTDQDTKQKTIGENAFNGLIDQEIKRETERQIKQGTEWQNLILPDRSKIREGIISKFFKDAFLIFITDRVGWKKIENARTKIKEVESILICDIQLNELDDKLISFDPKIHEGSFDSPWPCIKLLLNNDTQYHPYKFLSDLIIEDIRINASVSEVSNLTLSNSAGNLDHSIPFTPFGPAPVPGSYLRIQNPLILQKNLSELFLNISWIGLPQSGNGFKDYYQAYPYSIDNRIFKAQIAQTRTGNHASGKQMNQPFELFKTDGDTLSNEENEIEVNLQNLDFKNQIDQSGSNKNEHADQLFFVLTNPEIAFGHQVFPNLYAEAALKSARFRRKPIELPNQPYTPVIEHLTVSYSNTVKEIMLRKQDNSACDIKLIHIYPFGHIQVLPGPVKSQCFLLPQIKHKGNLFIGLEQVKSGDIVSLGFELVPAVYNHTVISAPKIEWEYLSNNEWASFDGLLVEDSTDGLIKSGIVKIELPASVQFDNTCLPQGKFWIRAFSTGKEDLNSRIKNVFTQAVGVISDHSTSNLLQELTDVHRVQKINFEGKKGIGKITGPFALELNDSLENEESFYSRVSEQMRHKNRVVTNWDIERIILDRFKKIEKVRVYGRNSHPKELVKGSSVQIVLIPRNNLNDGTKKRSNMVDFSTLLEVKKYISQFVSPHAKIEVSNPVYEQLKVKCSVKFKDYQKRGYFKNALNNELISFLSPDIENSYIEKGFDESISKTEILNYIESRPYVDFVTQFSVLQLVKGYERNRIIDTAKKENIEELETISAYAILTSAPEHQIDVIPDEKPLVSNASGIGDFSIESDFVISEAGNYN